MIIKEAQRILTNSKLRSSYDLSIPDEMDYQTDENDNWFENDDQNDYLFNKSKKWWETEVIDNYEIDVPNIFFDSSIVLFNIFQTGGYILVFLPVILLILIPAIFWCLKLLLIPTPIFSLTPNE